MLAMGFPPTLARAILVHNYQPGPLIHAHRRHPRDRDPVEIVARQFELRLLRDDDVGGRRHHRRGARGQAGCRLRLQLDRTLRLRRADARAFHPAHPRRQAGCAARRRRQSRSRENPRLHDAAREGRRPQRALDRDRHHRGGGVGRRRQDRRQAAASPAGGALQRRARSPTKCSVMSAVAGTGRARPSATCRTKCAAISTPATPW